MSCRTDVLCHSGGPRIRGKGKKNVKHLECGGKNRRALRKDTILLQRSYSPNRHAHHEDGERGPNVPRTEKGGPGHRRSPGSRDQKVGRGGAGSCSKKQSVDDNHLLLLLIKQGHTTERVQLFSK